MTQDVFISYSKRDKALADAMCHHLERQSLRCWMAPRDLRPGFDYGAEIVDGIKSSRVLVLIFTASANTSQHVKNEVERAVSSGIPVIPFRTEDVQPSKALELFISPRHWLDAMIPPMEAHFNLLASHLQALLANKSTIAGGQATPAPILFNANGSSVQAGAKPMLDRGAGPPRLQFSRRMAVFVLCACVALLVCVGRWCMPSPLDQMERYRQRAEDTLNSVDWPEQLSTLLRDWERDILRLPDPRLRESLLANIEIMRQKIPLLARPAVRDALGEAAQQIAEARDRQANSNR
jgi:hypothetical protein